MDFVQGVLVGVAASGLVVVVSWFVRNRVIVPRIMFSDDIEKYPIQGRTSNQSGYRYRFALRNVGRRRVIDIEVRATAHLPGLGVNTQVVRIPILRPPGPPMVRVAALAGSRRGRRSKARFYGLQVNDLADRFLASPIYEPLHEALRSRTLLLEDLLGHAKAKLTVAVFGFDEISGTRKLFEAVYTTASIKEGQFVGLKVVPLPEETGEPTVEPHHPGRTVSPENRAFVRHVAGWWLGATGLVSAVLISTGVYDPPRWVVVSGIVLAGLSFLLGVFAAVRAEREEHQRRVADLQGRIEQLTKRPRFTIRALELPVLLSNQTLDGRPVLMVEEVYVANRSERPLNLRWQLRGSAGEKLDAIFITPPGIPVFPPETHIDPFSNRKAAVAFVADVSDLTEFVVDGAALAVRDEQSRTTAIVPLPTPEDGFVYPPGEG